MLIVVFGAGFVGSSLCSLFKAAGHSVVPVTRNGDDGSEVCDIGNFKEVTRLRDLVGKADATIHCASSSNQGGDALARYQAIYIDGCRNIISAFPQARFVFVSSSSVYGQIDGSVVNEESLTEPLSVTSKLLLEAENVALNFGGSVARLAGIYGPNRSYLLKRYLEGRAKIDGNVSDSEGRWINQIHRDDAACALAHIIEMSNMSGIYNVCDDTPLRQRSCYEEFNRRFGKGVPEVRPPDEKKARGWSNKQVSNTKLREAGWILRYPSYFDALENDPKLLISISENGLSCS